MDNIDLFVDRFVIHSETREALVLNCYSVEKFTNELRELVSIEIRDILLYRAPILDMILDNEIKLTEPHRHVSPQHDRLVDARTALVELHNDIIWNKEQ